MKPKKDEILRAKVREIVARKLEACTVAINPTDYGNRIVVELSETERQELLAFQDTILKQIVIDEIKGQTKPKETVQQGFWPLDDWISGAKENHRIHYRDAVWSDHLAHRENQIKSLRRQNASFEAYEQRREQLSKAGMATEPNMTTEQAVKQIDGNDQ